MNGSIYDFVLYNYEFLTADIDSILHDEISLGYPWLGDCTFCPKATLLCISACNYNYYIQTNENCGSWLASWERGCTNPTDCNLCEDAYCVTCNYFGLNQCTECQNGYSHLSDGTWSWEFGPTPCVECQSGFTLLNDGTWYWNFLIHLENWVDTCPTGWTPEFATKTCV